MMIATLGIDLGKNLNSAVGLDATGRVVMRRRVRRATLKELATRLPVCTVAMEACCGTHHVGRLFAAQAPQLAADRRFVQRHAELLPQPLRRIPPPPGRHAVDGRDGARVDDLGQGGALLVGQLARGTPGALRSIARQAPRR